MGAKEKRMRPDRVVTRADAEERARRVWTARVAGATWEQAAQVAGYAQAQNAIRVCHNYFGTLPSIDREQERELWRARMEWLWRQSMRDARAQRPGAVRAAVAVAQRAAQLFGLDEPSRVAVEVGLRTDEQILAVIRAGGLPTRAERARYAITDAEIRQIRAEAGLEGADDDLIRDA